MKKDKSIFDDVLRISLKDHPYLILVVLFCMLLGIAAGAASIPPLANIMGSDYLVSSLSGYSTVNLRALLHQSLLNTSLYLLLILSRIWIPGILFTVFGMTVKGFFIGIGIFAFIHCYGSAGIVGILLSLLLPECAMLILMSNASLKSLQAWLVRTKAYLTGNTPIITQMDLRGIYAGLTVLLLFTIAGHFVSYAGTRLFYLIFDVASGR